ncbi:MAG TPA: magnesium protoporphyrin IX methyltransferase [Gemmatimonadaceae bacterium]|nr:magnesium protoporphyrin IX methyltransferase [Gemmatimonadaceae bacterium]
MAPLTDAGTPGSHTYTERRAWLHEYFDRTAAAAWATLTSDSQVSWVRRTVREGRERMRHTLSGYFPADLTGLRILDAGCGTGVQAVELAQRGASVVAIDLSPTLVGLAETRSAGKLGKGSIDWRSGDMLDPALGSFDYVVAMDSLIHYRMADMLDAYAALAARTRVGMAVTFAPRTPALATLKAIGSMFPRRDRAPAIEPVAPDALMRGVAADSRLVGWRIGRTQRIESGFYKSQALELRREIPGKG